MKNVKEFIIKHQRPIFIGIVILAFVIMIVLIIKDARKKPDVVKYAGYQLDKDGNLVYTGEISYNPDSLAAALHKDMSGHNLWDLGRRNMKAYGEWLALKEPEFIGLYNYYNNKYAQTKADNLLYRLSQEREYSAPPVIGSQILDFFGLPSLDDVVGAKGFSLVRDAILAKADKLKIDYLDID